MLYKEPYFLSTKPYSRFTEPSILSKELYILSKRALYATQRDLFSISKALQSIYRALRSIKRTLNFIQRILHSVERVLHSTGWRRLIGSPKLQIIFHKRATKYRALLRKMTYKDKGSYDSSPPRITRVLHSTKQALYLGQKRPIFYITQPYMLWKEPCNLSKEPYIR